MRIDLLMFVECRTHTQTHTHMHLKRRRNQIFNKPLANHQHAPRNLLSNNGPQSTDTIKLSDKSIIGRFKEQEQPHLSSHTHALIETPTHAHTLVRSISYLTEASPSLDLRSKAERSVTSKSNHWEATVTVWLVSHDYDSSHPKPV